MSRIIRVFETTKTVLEHVETRRSRRIDAQHDIIIQCICSRDKVTTINNAIRQSPLVIEVSVLNDREQEAESWYPRHISELDNCTHLVTKFEPELDSDHPGFTDKKYRERRKQIADIAFEYKQGHVYKELKLLFPTHACKEHIDVFQVLEKECGYSPTNIPQLEDVSNFLKKKTGFQLRPVSGLLSARDFLASLAFRVFQCTQYVRHGSKPDHSPEPDCIHELLGHVPMLAIPKFAQFSQELGLASLGASDADIEKIATLYWFTVEFGLCKQNGEVRAYGAGALSSYGELRHAISDAPKKLPFNPYTTAVQEYTDEDLQPLYFIVESFDDMMQKMREFAETIRRPRPVRYDPYTQSIQILETTEALQTLSIALRSEMDNVQRALTGVQGQSSNKALTK
ncbi:hypothetical protein FSP39_021011 [Pinctada imbricata]|uniref:Biopterin-dependent aromatic amino acid hydroxylase family profile domain-containing protein n=1 Tax=Pinctada imbricata TaxID=66713 RepID=A0AA89C643_PINIB|nr:hypothetical protein FSP39_021011 [Pinctada imbricata]